MHTVGKVFMAIGLVILVFGGILLAVGTNNIDEGVDSLEENEWALEGVISGSVEIIDDDGEGEIGFTIFIEGTYEDTNGDGIWDFCEEFDQSEGQTDFTTTHSEDTSNSFYYACSTDWGWEEERQDGSKNLVKIGDSAGGYTNGTATVTCASVCWVQYDDKALVDVLDDLGQAAGGFFQSVGGGMLLCCGGFFVVFGLILGVSIGNGQPKITVIQQGAGGMPMGGQMVQQTTMQQPVYQQVAQTPVQPQTTMQQPAEQTVWDQNSPENPF
jgi:hypothetical protein